MTFSLLEQLKFSTICITDDDVGGREEFHVRRGKIPFFFQTGGVLLVNNIASAFIQYDEITRYPGSTLECCLYLSCVMSYPS